LLKSGDCKKSVVYLQKALSLVEAEVQRNESLKQEINRNLGTAYFKLDDMEKAFKHHEDDCYGSIQSGDLNSERMSRDNMIWALLGLHRHDEAIICCEKYIQICEQLENKKNLARALHAMAYLHHMRAKKNEKHKNDNFFSDFKIAADYYSKSLEISESINDDIEIGRTCGMLGLCCYFLGQPEKSLPHYKKRLLIARQFGDNKAILRVSMNMGNSYVKLQKFQDGIDCYLEALQLSRQLSELIIEGKLSYMLGKTYLLMGENRLAVEHFNRHKEIAIKVDDKEGLCFALSTLTSSYMQLGDNQRASECASFHLKTAQLINDERYISMANEDLLKLSGEAYGSLLPRSGDKSQLLDGSGGKMLDLLTRLQGRRLDDQRVETEENGSIKNKEDKMTNIMRMLQSQQSRRLDEQRVSMTSLPGFQRIGSDGNNIQVINNQPQENGHEQNGNHDNHRAEPQPANDVIEEQPHINVVTSQKTNGGGLSDEFIENLMRCQNLRMDDQRTTVKKKPHGTMATNNGTMATNNHRNQVVMPTSSQTLPSEDFLDMIDKLQSDRMTDQRYSFKPKKQKLSENN